VVCVSSFLVWKDEAFGLWESQWGALYPKGSPSAGVIETIVSSYYLVTVVDNDYVAGDLFSLLVSATDVRCPHEPPPPPALSPTSLP
jgi:methylenetetrahydrofolate reductase (NADPH)